MKIFSWNDILSFLDNGKEDAFFNQGCGISIGSFDGIHKGHKLLLDTLIVQCEKENLLKGIVTFSKPLAGIKHHNDYLGDVLTLEQRLKMFSNFGIDFVIIVDFDESFASMLGIDFLNLLVNVCNMKLIAEGIDFRCGFKGATDFQSIKYFGKEKNIKTFFVEPVFYKNALGKEERISSSIIRMMISKGFFLIVENLLERPYQLILNEKKLVIEKSSLKQVIPPKNIYHCKNEENKDIRVKIDDDNIILSDEAEFLIF